MKKAALIATITALALIPAAGEAAKAPATKSCPEGALCVWTKANYEGKRLVLKAQADPSNKIGNQIDNLVSSLKNKSSEISHLFEKRNGKGNFRCFDSGTKVPNLGAPSWDFNNQASSSAVAASDPPSCNV